MKRNAPTTSGADEAGSLPVPHAGTSSEFGSKFEAIAASPRSDGLGDGVVVGGGDEGVDGELGCSPAELSAL